MPNNITNIIRFGCTEERFREIAESLKRDGSYLGSVDFNKLIPMPEELDIESGSLGQKGLHMYRKYLRETEGMDAAMKQKVWDAYLAKSGDAPKAMELGKRYHENSVKYSAPTWYEWCCNNWGTKWNAYNCERADTAKKELRFETAWSSVPSVIRNMSEKFPETEMEYSWADEDIGSNVGRMTVKGGEIRNMRVPSQGSREAYEMSADIIGFDLSDAGFELSEDKRTYVYAEREDLFDPPER